MQEEKRYEFLFMEVFSTVISFNSYSLQKLMYIGWKATLQLQLLSACLDWESLNRKESGRLFHSAHTTVSHSISVNATHTTEKHIKQEKFQEKCDNVNAEMYKRYKSPGIFGQQTNQTNKQLQNI